MAVSDFQMTYRIKTVKETVTRYLLMKNRASPSPIWQCKSSHILCPCFFSESTPFKLKPYLSPHINTHLWFTSYHLGLLLCGQDSCFFGKLDNMLMKEFLTVVLFLSAASPVTSSNQSINQDEFCFQCKSTLRFFFTSSVHDDQWILGIFWPTFVISSSMIPLSFNLSFVNLLQL